MADIFSQAVFIGVSAALNDKALIFKPVFYGPGEMNYAFDLSGAKSLVSAGRD